MDKTETPTLRITWLISNSTQLGQTEPNSENQHAKHKALTLSTQVKQNGASNTTLKPGRNQTLEIMWVLHIDELSAIEVKRQVAPVLFRCFG